MVDSTILARFRGDRSQHRLIAVTVRMFLTPVGDLAAREIEGTGFSGDFDVAAAGSGVAISNRRLMTSVSPLT